MKSGKKKKCGTCQRHTSVRCSSSCQNAERSRTARVTLRNVCMWVPTVHAESKPLFDSLTRRRSWRRVAFLKVIWLKFKTFMWASAATRWAQTHEPLTAAKVWYKLSHQRIVISHVSSRKPDHGTREKPRHRLDRKGGWIHTSRKKTRPHAHCTNTDSTLAWCLTTGWVWVTHWRRSTFNPTI